MLRRSYGGFFCGGTPPSDQDRMASIPANLSKPGEFLTIRNVMEGSHCFFSIIVPTHNRPEQLSVCLKFLAEQEYPRDQFEVIVVNDGSELPLEKVVSSFCDKLNVTLLSQSHA